jgi:hypothetical protein
VDLGLRALCGSTPRKCMWILAEVVLWIYSNEVYVDLGLGSSVDLLRGSVCESRPACFMWIYSKEVYLDLDFGSSVDLLRGNMCGSRLRWFCGYTPKSVCGFRFR